MDTHYRQKMKLKQILVSATFVAILILPTIDSVFNLFPEVENLENRNLNTISVPDPSFLDGFPKEFDEYYTDNFDFRNQLLSFNSRLKFNMFNIQPVVGEAFIGLEGWMYLVKDEMDIYLGNNLVNDNKLARYYDIFSYRKNFLDSIGCKYYIVIAPTKTSVYPEFLPLSKRKTGQSTLTDQIVNLLDTISGLCLIDLRPVLKEAKGDIRMYHKTDNHWNDYGSYIAYKAIMKKLSIDFPKIIPNHISKFKIDTVVVDGMALTDMMGIYDEIYENKITCISDFNLKSQEGSKSNYPITSDFPYTSEYEMVYTTKNDSLPKLLSIRDSFGFSLIPFLSEHFSESVYIFDGWHHEFNKEIVLNEKPDIYIQLVLESYIPSIYKYAKNP